MYGSAESRTGPHGTDDSSSTQQAPNAADPLPVTTGSKVPGQLGHGILGLEAYAPWAAGACGRPGSRTGVPTQGHPPMRSPGFLVPDHHQVLCSCLIRDSDQKLTHITSGGLHETLLLLVRAVHPSGAGDAGRQPRDLSWSSNLPANRTHINKLRDAGMGSETLTC